jgi:hypothetical protein
LRHRRHGARVHSDSWGSDSTAYDYLAYSVDMYTWRNQDFLSVFAAGNFGAQQQASTTVTTPATAKNTVTVGATLGLIPGYRAATDAKVGLPFAFRSLWAACRAGMQAAGAQRSCLCHCWGVWRSRGGALYLHGCFPKW